MLKILECRDTTKYSDIIKDKANGDDDVRLVESFDNDDVNGYCMYKYFGLDEVIIFDYEDNGDLCLCDGIIRAVLFKAMLKGIDTAKFCVEGIKRERLFKLKFVANADNMLYNINDFMNSCKKCKEI